MNASGFKLVIECENEAFGVTRLEQEGEVARLLRFAADRVEQGTLGGALLDSNGNTVGHFTFYNEEHPDGIG